MDYLPKPGQARGVQIDRRGDRIGTRYPVILGLVGEARPLCGSLTGWSTGTTMTPS
jgi:hypothetical protein